MSISNLLADNTNVFDANGATSNPKFEEITKKWSDGVSPSELAQKGQNVFSQIANITIDGKE